FRQQLSQLVDENPDIFAQVRGRGLLSGLQCKPMNTDVVAALRAHKLLSVGAGENTIRLLPPLNVTREEVGIAIDALRAACVDLRKPSTEA
ncbi:aminotransferase class III-fold pyridoxal phosphate-dependent enzyme, partial [Alphaproteobacteria bacterium]|nr:aminotransferase class III-fold pyridoxal phosphate-dependent enzyme [Alphaproteobacteria bacterium]